MRYGYPLVCAGLVVATLLLVSCGGGNSDVFPSAELAISPTSGPDSFLLFPNPQKQADDSLQTNTSAYATAYYAAIDPGNNENTLDKWKAANGFGDLSTGTETTVVFGDVKDLGYGRRITARKNNDGTIAVMVENYLVSAAADYTYSSLNLDAAVARDQRWHVGTNGIEFSGSTCINTTVPITDPATCVSTVKFAKFYTFNPTTGQRVLAADLDGRGDKAMPGICISCHGGRGDPLTPAIGSPTGLPLFPLVGNSASQKRGDVQAHLQPLIVDSFGYSATPGFTRADQEAKLKTINEWVLSSYPVPATPACLTTPPYCPEDATRRVASPYEWQGTAAIIIKKAYGNDGLPNATFSDIYVPANWSNMGQTALYKSVVASSCRTCHIQRGIGVMDDINFDNYCAWNGIACNPAALNKSYFFGYADRIKAHVIDHGNMPLAKIVYQRFWGSSEADTLATFLQTAQTQAVRDASGAVLKPGRPVAVPGPDRTTDSPAILSAANSLYATTYAWSIVSGSGGSLLNANSAQATLTGTIGQTYGVQLVVGNGTTQSAPVQVNVTIAAAPSPALPIAANAIRFTDIKAFIQGSTPNCTGCHAPGGSPRPPIFYTDIDRNGDGLIQSTTGQTDDLWFYTELRGRINFTDIAASPLLLKPTGHHHGGGMVIDTASTAACAGSCSGYANLGDYYKAYYNMIVLWILNGAPY